MLFEHLTELQTKLDQLLQDTAATRVDKEAVREKLSEAKKGGKELMVECSISLPSTCREGLKEYNSLSRKEEILKKVLKEAEGASSSAFEKVAITSLRASLKSLSKSWKSLEGDPLQEVKSLEKSLISSQTLLGVAAESKARLSEKVSSSLVESEKSHSSLRALRDQESASRKKSFELAKKLAELANKIAFLSSDSEEVKEATLKTQEKKTSQEGILLGLLEQLKGKEKDRIVLLRKRDSLLMMQ